MSEAKTLSAFFKENEIVKEPVKYVASKRYICLLYTSANELCRVYGLS